MFFLLQEVDFRANVLFNKLWDNFQRKIIIKYVFSTLSNIYDETFCKKVGSSWKLMTIYAKNRGSRSNVFCKKGIVKDFAKFTGKQLCQSLFLIKLQAATASLLKKKLWHKCFPMNFAEFLRTSTTGFFWRRPIINVWQGRKCMSDYVYRSHSSTIKISFA